MVGMSANGAGAVIKEQWVARVLLSIVWLAWLAQGAAALAQQAPASATSESTGSPNSQVPSDWIESPVTYSRSMLVCVSADGVAGLRFVEPFSLANETGNGVIGVTCEWRFRPVTQADEQPEKSEQRGSIRLFAKFKDGVRQKGLSEIECGPIRLIWRAVDQQSGWVASEAAQHQLHAIALDWFAERAMPMARQGRRPPLDLARFFWPKSPPAQPAAAPAEEQLASFVSYAECVTMIFGPWGVTAVEFGAPFERAIAANQRHHGVTYRYRHFPKDGRLEEGTGELFELYRDNGYNSAGSKLTLQLGSTELVWSVGGSAGGWLYYDPSQLRVWTCRATQAEQLLSVLRSAPVFPAAAIPTTRPADTAP